MTATDIFTLTLILIILASASLAGFGIWFSKDLLTAIGTFVATIAVSLLAFIMLVSIAAVVVVDTIG